LLTVSDAHPDHRRLCPYQQGQEERHNGARLWQPARADVADELYSANLTVTHSAVSGMCGSDSFGAPVVGRRRPSVPFSDARRFLRQVVDAAFAKGSAPCYLCQDTEERHVIGRTEKPRSTRAEERLFDHEQDERKRQVVEILRTNDLVLISLIEAILQEEGIDFFVADRHMSAVEGSLGFLPRRILVDSDDVSGARQALINAGLGSELQGVGSQNG
jgi:hypothetical protein